MEIPLFPLPNLVLFPQVAVPLHIFEERYKLMINRCIDQADVFGLVLLNGRRGTRKAKTPSFVSALPRALSRWTGWKMAASIFFAPENPVFVFLKFTGRHPTGLPTWSSSRTTPK